MTGSRGLRLRYRHDRDGRGARSAGGTEVGGFLRRGRNDAFGEARPAVDFMLDPDCRPLLEIGIPQLLVAAGTVDDGLPHDERSISLNVKLREGGKGLTEEDRGAASGGGSFGGAGRFH